jgi:hypothetical protein
MYFLTIALAFVFLTPPWLLGPGMFLAPWFVLGASALWLGRLLAYVSVGIFCRYPRCLLWRPWKQAAIYPLALVLLMLAANVDVTLRVTMALHQAQLGRLAGDIIAGRPVVHETMWVYSLDRDDSISGCPTLRIPESDEILVYHPGGPPPISDYPFWKLWGDWYDYRHY